MARIKCGNCNDCVIKKECDVIDEAYDNSLIPGHNALWAIYEQGKAEGRKEAIDEFARALIIDGEVSTPKAIRIAKRLKEQKNDN